MEPRGAACYRSSTLLLLAAILILVAAASASAIGDKCAACKAVAAELEIGISSEKPRNHLDLRNRLNSKGQREGKVIDYRVSELRIVELLDDLCDKMQDYTLQQEMQQTLDLELYTSLTVRKSQMLLNFSDMLAMIDLYKHLRFSDVNTVMGDIIEIVSSSYTGMNLRSIFRDLQQLVTKAITKRRENTKTHQ